ncbi:MAG: hypothetical protein HUJ92_09085, partial [Bacteroidales bacterium]|nr:hypothetical protein [Bacteroidales bacterium]
MRNIRHIFLLAALIPCLANAQVAYYAAEAARCSENLYEGSARTIAMGNAFTALGGDLGAVSINPASTAVLRSSEFSISGNFGRSYGNASINGNSSINSSVFNFYVPNVGVSFNFNTGNYGGLLNYSIGFVGNRTNDFNSIIDCVNSNFSQSTWLGAASCYLNGISESEVKDMSYFTNGYGVPASSLLAWDTYLISKLEGPNNEYIGSTENIYDDLIFVGGDLDQEFYRRTRGGAYQWALNFSGNVNDCFFFGANLNLHTLDYAADEIYTETAKTDTFDDGFKEMRHNYYQRTTGTGVSGKFGLIYLIGGFRIGATITTPTLLNITESEEQYMRSAFTNGRSYESTTDVRRYQYRIVSPFRFS